MKLEGLEDQEEVEEEVSESLNHLHVEEKIEENHCNRLDDFRSFLHDLLLNHL